MKQLLPVLLLTLAGCPESTIEAFRSYGYCLGMAFQIVDDILDFVGDEEELGKPAGSDLLEGTITLPAMLFLESNPKDNPIKRYRLAKRGRHALLASALGAVRESDCIGRSYEMAGEYIRRANAAIEGLPNTEGKDSLIALGTWVLERRS